MQYAYDLDGRRQILVYPSGNVLTNTYTARGQVKAIYANGPPPLATFSYDANGNRLSEIRAADSRFSPAAALW